MSEPINPNCKIPLPNTHNPKPKSKPKTTTTKKLDLSHTKITQSPYIPMHKVSRFTKGKNQRVVKKQNPRTKKPTFISPQMKNNKWVVHMNEREPNFAVLAIKSITSNLKNHTHLTLALS